MTTFLIGCVVTAFVLLAASPWLGRVIDGD
ncbi:hypothetical protein LCGC14_1092410 [marine sediment metagenome]|uniref:Uncharacterized protein n=1 Tax=marine sediment metagenome TaxID=412755 RepID=A0A0F9MC00_9ZZZZ